MKIQKYQNSLFIYFLILPQFFLKKSYFFSSNFFKILIICNQITIFSAKVPQNILQSSQEVAKLNFGLLVYCGEGGGMFPNFFSVRVPMQTPFLLLQIA